MVSRALPILAGCLLFLAAGCDRPEVPNPSYTGSLRIIYKPRDPALAPPRAPSQDTTFAFKTTDSLSELVFGGCHVTFELPKAKGDQFKWVLKRGGPCPTPSGAAMIRTGEFVVYPKGGLMITLSGSTPDDRFDVEWSTVIGGEG